MISQMDTEINRAIVQAQQMAAVMPEAQAEHDIRKAKIRTQAARQRKEAKDFTNADELNPKIWEETIRSMRNTKPAFRDAEWNREYAEAKRKLAIAYRHRSRYG